MQKRESESSKNEEREGRKQASERKKISNLLTNLITLPAWKEKEGERTKVFSIELFILLSSPHSSQQRESGDDLFFAQEKKEGRGKRERERKKPRVLNFLQSNFLSCCACV